MEDIIGKSISRNFVVDELITDINKIKEKALYRESLYLDNMKKILPAGFVYFMRFAAVDRMIDRKVIYSIKKKTNE